jgi:hypothetical protein
VKGKNVKRIELSEDFFADPASPNVGGSTAGSRRAVERQAVQIILGKSRRSASRKTAPPRRLGRRRGLLPLMELPFQLTGSMIVVMAHMFRAALPTFNGRPGRHHYR